MAMAFANWLLAELEQRGWTQADLARRAGISKTSISDLISGRRNIGTDLATNIAKGLHVPVGEVYRAAGLLPQEKKIDEDIEQIVHELQDLTREEKREFLSYIRWRTNQKK